METYILTCTFIFGTILGSFFNVVIWRTPRHESIVVGSSHCPSCNTPIKPYDLIPILSYIFLLGKCRACGTKISVRYPLIEALTGLLFTLVVARFGLTVTTLINLIFTSVLILITMIDIDTMEISDLWIFTILGLAVANLFVTPYPIMDHILGGLIISIPFLIIAWLTQGLGGGDIKLMMAAGLLLAYPSTLVSFFIASITGGLYAAYLLIFKHSNRKMAIPFGPFLCLGLYISLLYGPELIYWYISTMF